MSRKISRLFRIWIWVCRNLNSYWLLYIIYYNSKTRSRRITTVVMSFLLENSGDGKMEMVQIIIVTAALAVASVISGIFSNKTTKTKGIIKPFRARNFFLAPLTMSGLLGVLMFVSTLNNLLDVKYIYGMIFAFVFWLIARPFSYKRLLSNW